MFANSLSNALSNTSCSADAKFTRYEDWLAHAKKLDDRPMAKRWVTDDSSSLYDHKVIRRRLNELREVRASEDVGDLLFYMNEGFHGNMAGMGTPGLYQKTAQGKTKQLISDYIEEMVGALEQLASQDLTDQQKVRFFRRSADCFGRSALMLSGAGSLGPFHAGVVKTMVAHDTLPNVISGSSAGSMIAATLGTRPEARTEEFWDTIPDTIGKPGARPSRGTLRQDDVRDIISELIPDLTFEEAFEETGLRINVSVAPTLVNQRSRLLNAVQSPNACIREAVLASCAVPGVFPPVTLAAKTQSGKRKPYVASRRWMDGSVTDDLPASRLARLYAVNHFILSQANPIVLWAMSDPNANDLFSQLAGLSQSAVREWARTVYPFAMNGVRDLYPLNVFTRFGFGLLTQDYTADINLYLENYPIDPTRLLSPLSTQETRNLILAGERATWPRLEMIRNTTAVSRCIDRQLIALTGTFH